MNKLNQPFLEIHFLTILMIWDSTGLLYCILGTCCLQLYLPSALLILNFPNWTTIPKLRWNKSRRRKHLFCIFKLIPVIRFSKLSIYELYPQWAVVTSIVRFVFFFRGTWKTLLFHCCCVCSSPLSDSPPQHTMDSSRAHIYFPKGKSHTHTHTRTKQLATHPIPFPEKSVQLKDFTLLTCQLFNFGSTDWISYLPRRSSP